MDGIPVPGERLCGLTWFANLLWFSDAGLNQIFAVDPASGEIPRRIDCPEVRTGLTNLGGYLVQVVGEDRRLRKLDPQTGAVTEEFPNPLPGQELCGIEATAAGIWLGANDPEVLELRSSAPGFGVLNRIHVADSIAGVTWTGRYVAYANYSGAKIYLVDPEIKSVVTSFDVDGNPTGLTWDGNHFWYCDHTNVRLRRLSINPLLDR